MLFLVVKGLCGIFDISVGDALRTVIYEKKKYKKILKAIV